MAQPIKISQVIQISVSEMVQLTKMSQMFQTIELIPMAKIGPFQVIQISQSVNPSK